MQQDHQQEGLHMSTRITYSLQACKCHKTISKKACTCQPESHTYWEQANVTRPSARWPAHVNQNHLLSEIRQMPEDHQQENQHMSTTITYILQACKCHKTISKWACTCQPESLTPWDQANATIPSARGPTHVNQNHLQTESRQMPPDHQQESLHMSTRITYFLRSGKCQETISKRTSTCQPESLTPYKHANATRPSAKGPAHVNHNQNHLLSEHANVTCALAISKMSYYLQLPPHTFWRQAIYQPNILCQWNIIAHSLVARQMFVSQRMFLKWMTTNQLA